MKNNELWPVWKELCYFWFVRPFTNVPEYHFNPSAPFTKDEVQKVIYVMNRGGAIYSENKLIVKAIFS